MKNRIKILRAEQNLSQHQLAQLCGVSRHTIIAIEKQKHEPSIKLASKISHILNTDIAMVFDLNDID